MIEVVSIMNNFPNIRTVCKRQCFWINTATIWHSNLKERMWQRGALCSFYLVAIFIDNRVIAAFAAFINGQISRSDCYSTCRFAFFAANLFFDVIDTRINRSVFIFTGTSNECFIHQFPVDDVVRIKSLRNIEANRFICRNNAGESVLFSIENNLCVTNSLYKFRAVIGNNKVHLFLTVSSHSQLVKQSHFSIVRNNDRFIFCRDGIIFNFHTVILSYFFFRITRNQIFGETIDVVITSAAALYVKFDQGRICCPTIIFIFQRDGLSWITYNLMSNISRGFIEFFKIICPSYSHFNGDPTICSFVVVLEHFFVVNQIFICLIFVTYTRNTIKFYIEQIIDLLFCWQSWSFFTRNFFCDLIDTRINGRIFIFTKASDCSQVHEHIFVVDIFNHKSFGNIEGYIFTCRNNALKGVAFLSNTSTFWRSQCRALICNNKIHIFIVVTRYRHFVQQSDTAISRNNNRCIWFWNGIIFNSNACSSSFCLSFSASYEGLGKVVDIIRTCATANYLECDWRSYTFC